MKTTKQIASEVINMYENVSNIKRMRPTIADIYGLNNSAWREVLNECRTIINGHICANYDGAISNVKNGRLALIDAFKRACKSGKFVNECKNLDVLRDIDYIIKRYYNYVDIEGNALTLKKEYKKDENGNFVRDEDGKYIVLSAWYEVKPITAGNASAIVVACLNNMKRFAKGEYLNFAEGWNIKKVGK